MGFQITDDHGAGLLGLYGSVQGTYGYLNKDITTTGGLQEATPVTLISGTGTNIFTIWDSSGFALTGNVNWVDIDTFGITGGLNTEAKINLSNFAYSGTDLNLKKLSRSQADVVATFQFNPAESLKALEHGTHNTSYSGTISTVPDGGVTLMLLGGALFGLETLRRRFRV